ncbi:uncharacterized protein CTRU02_208348 [Colletotrichum truncatum]|uniref:Uncharacterized protein n=1 Tax=Colletotrichum truncatum TaxID=5467 RepID=A0ACC3YW21_COLTU|nr:uncharacterized protein CTRU02_07467 [Colletotrichum truncatum]KAF6791127.1 hypothetical protein CTRU02_07467 [Colletotrichum truncatum]
MALSLVTGQDNIGFKNGTYTLKTQNWEAVIVKSSATLASLKPVGNDFDFLPYDLMQLGRRVQNGCYHWGDVNILYRTSSSAEWQETSSAAQRTPVVEISSEALLSSDLSPTMSLGPLNITREWIDVSGDLGLRFTIINTGDIDVEIGGLGFAAAVNNIFTKRNVSDVNEKCAFMEPYIGQDAGHLRVIPLKGVGPALLVTPLHKTPLEAYRWLWEDNKGETRIGSNMWEGYFEWTVHSKAWAEQKWKDAEPWNLPTSAVLEPGQSRTYGLRFTAVKEGVRHIDSAIRNTGTPNAIGVPGYIIPRDTQGTLSLQATSEISATEIHPPGALEVLDLRNKTYAIQPSESAWGRVRLTVTYGDNKTQTIHSYVTKPAAQAVADMGEFLTTEHWFVDESDPFGRSPSIMGYDGETRGIIEQDGRTAPAGLSDEGGAGAYVAAAIKQTFRPNINEISKLEEFVDKVLFKTVQDADYGQKKSHVYEITRAYNYVWPAATYWSLYRVGRSYPGLLKTHTWDWYFDTAYKTVMRAMESDIGFNKKGLMGETVFGEILLDLEREDRTAEVKSLKEAMKSRVDRWLKETYPYGSEQSWDSTGQEGVYFWSNYFEETDLATKVKNSVLGYMTSVPHWGYNGNARRYWDFVVAGKLQVVERQIHHYGSGLNSLVLLSPFRQDPSDNYLLRVGYGGTTGPLSNIREDGFASCAMHAWPEHLFWDRFSGDYGPNFVGMVLGSGSYLVEDPDLGLVVYGGTLYLDGDMATVEVQDPLHQKFSYNARSHEITLTLGQMEDVPRAEAAIVWITATTKSTRKATEYTVKVDGAEVEKERQGSKVDLGTETVRVQIG